MPSENKCECCGVSGAEMVAGMLTRRWDSDIVGAHYREACLNEHGYGPMAYRIRMRRVEASQPKFYGTMPDPLPETLPAGTRTKRGDGNFVARSVLTRMGNFGFEDRFYGFVKIVGGQFDGVECRGVTLAANVDWPTVPVQEAKPEAAEPAIILAAPIDADAPAYAIKLRSTCRDCSSPPTVGDLCVYCATRHAPINEATKALHTERFTVSVEARERLRKADARERHVPTKSERELAAGHPAGWPSQDGED